MNNCIHNQRTRYTHGFYCKDCETFFPKASSTYRQGEYMSTLWMCLHNVNVDSVVVHKDVSALRDEIGIGVLHANYEELITKAEALLKKYGSTPDSATITLKKEK